MLKSKENRRESAPAFSSEMHFDLSIEGYTMRKMAEQASTDTTDSAAQQPLPDYMHEVYDWAYVDRRNVEWLDHNIVVRILLFFNDRRMMRAYLNEIVPGTKVWQVAHVYGDLVRLAAEKVGANGQFHLTDVTPIQVEHAERKLANVPQASVFHIDAAKWTGKDYDLVCSFFLLHEVPEEKKKQVVDRMLETVKPDGKLVFVDYHRPAPWQPIGWILRWVNAKLEPFAEALWHKEIHQYADRAAEFNWNKRTIFGGVYQIVTVTRKA